MNRAAPLTPSAQATGTPVASGTIRARGARTHNLRSVDLDLPRGKLIVFTGVSGSGKTSLAFDTLFAEGRRRYLESVAPYLRAMLDRLPRAEVDELTGLPPTVSVRQRDRPAGGPRSTVATLTEIHDHLRVLYARCGDVYCPECGAPIHTQTIPQMVSATMALPEGLRLHLLAPVVRGRRGKHREAFQLIRREGFVRARVDGVLSLIDTPLDIDPEEPHDIEIVIDRQIVKPGIEDRLTESFQVALKHGRGVAIVAWLDDEVEWVERVFSASHACLHCGTGYRELEPRTFSFNSPYGACPTCQGLGVAVRYDPTRVAPDRSLSLAGGALQPSLFRTSTGKLPTPLRRELEAWAKACRPAAPKWMLETPLAELPQESVASLFDGTEGFTGLASRLEQAAAADPDLAEELADFRSERTCPDCHGDRLGSAGRSVRVGGLTLPELTRLSVRDAAAAVATWTDFADRQPIAEPLLDEVRRRLDFLLRVDVGYLTLDRVVRTLSGGEAQRIRLAGCLAARLRGACYVLDEPTTGLHPRDAGRLLDVLEELTAADASVLVVEHDEAVIARADRIVDLGPGAGAAGGAVVFEGSPADLPSADGLTAEYVRGERKVERHRPRLEVASPQAEPDSWLTLRHLRRHNLKGVDLAIPLGRLVGLCGVSGAGKSTAAELLLEALQARFAGRPGPADAGELVGGASLVGWKSVDQRPIGRSPLSTPVSYCGLLDGLKKLFAATKLAKARGYKASRFGYTDPAGRCPECQGLGAVKLDLAFLPDGWEPCPTCRGKRYARATLEVRWKERSIADVLRMDVASAAEFLSSHPKCGPMLAMLRDVGLGHLTLDRWTTTLSGGEAQRLKLAKELAAPATPAAGPLLYLLDEPTAGLHAHDVAELLGVLERLVDVGNTVVVIEHHPALLAACDWLIELGPEGGAHGGLIIRAGEPGE